MSEDLLRGVELFGAGFSLRGYGFVAPASRRQVSVFATQRKIDGGTPALQAQPPQAEARAT
jgi:hypothetical protein